MCGHGGGVLCVDMMEVCYVWTWWRCVMCGHDGGVLCVDIVTMYNSSLNRCGLVWGPDTITKETGTILVPRPVWSKSHS